MAKKRKQNNIITTKYSFWCENNNQLSLSSSNFTLAFSRCFSRKKSCDRNNTAYGRYTWQRRGFNDFDALAVNTGNKYRTHLRKFRSRKHDFPSKFRCPLDERLETSFPPKSECHGQLRTRSMSRSMIYFSYLKLSLLSFVDPISHKSHRKDLHLY